MNKTGIIWTETTWNPFSGCKEVSEGCKFCYAKTIAEKYRGNKAFPDGFDLTIRPHKLNEPFKIKEPSIIFANSMSDLFWDEVPNSYRHKVIDVIEQTPQHEYQVLTKRPEAMLKFSKERKLPPNFWAGTTIENNRNRYRIDILNEVDAEIRFVSAEPLINTLEFEPGELDNIHWMITGGESGSHLWNNRTAEKRALVYYDRLAKKWLPRPDRIDWIRTLRDQSIENDVKFFHKQWGGSYPEAAGRELDGETWNEMPRYPGEKTEINNNYLKFIEENRMKSKRDQLLKESV